MSQPETPALALVVKPEPPTVTPERPGWGVYDRWMQNEKGARLKPGVYWHSYRRTKEDDEGETSGDGERPLRDDWSPPRCSWWPAL